MNKYGFLILLVLSACAMVADQYDYKPRQPNEVPATMQFENLVQNSLRIHVRKVNGLYLFNYDGAISGKTVSKEIKDNKIRLSPGKNEITFFIISGMADWSWPVSLDVKPGESYSIYVSFDRVWVSDRKGKIVADQKYTTFLRL